VKVIVTRFQTHNLVKEPNPAIFSWLYNLVLQYFLVISTIFYHFTNAKFENQDLKSYLVAYYALNAILFCILYSH